jgi:hypothetical protein
MNYPDNARGKWTPDEDGLLRKLIESSADIHDIALSLKRSDTAVKSRAHRLGISTKRVSFGLRGAKWK